MYTFFIGVNGVELFNVHSSPLRKSSEIQISSYLVPGNDSAISIFKIKHESSMGGSKYDLACRYTFLLNSFSSFDEKSNSTV